MSTLKEFGKDSEKQIEEARLTASELLNVEGGIDADQDEDECGIAQCVSGAVKTCYTGA
jgi:hypothetical protein